MKQKIEISILLRTENENRHTTFKALTICFFSRLLIYGRSYAIFEWSQNQVPLTHYSFPSFASIVSAVVNFNNP